MKRIACTTVIAIFLSFTNYAQNTFNVDRSFTPDIPADNRPFPSTLRITSPVRFGFTTDEKDEFKKELGIYIETLVNNLQDDSLFLLNDYNIIWPGFHTALLGEAQILHGYLKNGTNAGSILRYLPSPFLIESKLSVPSSLSVEQKKLPGNDQLEINLISIDPLRKFVFDWIQSTMYASRWLHSDIDIGYKKAWREMEASYAHMQACLVALRSLQKKPHLLDQSATTEALNTLSEWRRIKRTNNLITAIENSEPLQKMLWFTGGVIHMNPLLVTDPLHTYPASEPNCFEQPQFALLVDSLKKNNWPLSLFDTKKIINRVILPLNKDDDKQVNLIQYDAANNYTPYGTPGKYLSGSDQLLVAVHNLKSDHAIAITKNEEKLADQSEVMTQLDGIAGQVGGLIASLSPVLGSAGKIISLLQPTPRKSVPYPITVVNTRSQTMSLASKWFNLYADTLAVTESLRDDEELVSLDKTIYVEINGKKVGLVGESDADKKRLLLASYYPNPLRFFPLDSLYIFLIDRFVEFHAYKSLDYSNNYSLQTSAEEVLADYKEYIRPVEQYEDKLLQLTGDLAQSINQLRPFIRISNRSLPQSKIKETINEKPVLYTYVEEMKLPEATKKFNYELVETDKNKKVIAEVNNSIKLVKRTYFDLSAGLAYTFNSFTITETGSDNLPDRVWTSQLQFIAGLHYYPWGLIKPRNTWFRPWKERVSVFAGLSFNKPLDNYYLGVSFDPIPGVRTIIGAHGYRNTRYRIVNNAVAEKASGVDIVGPFIALNIEPYALIKLTGLIK